jgi:hypothetical protein
LQPPGLGRISAARAQALDDKAAYSTLATLGGGSESVFYRISALYLAIFENYIAVAKIEELE